jgi:hypothetical protein
MEPSRTCLARQTWCGYLATKESNRASDMPHGSPSPRTAASLGAGYLSIGRSLVLVITNAGAVRGSCARPYTRGDYGETQRSGGGPCGWLRGRAAGREISCITTSTGSSVFNEVWAFLPSAVIAWVLMLSCDSPVTKVTA